jgi:hypothetical protein
MLRVKSSQTATWKKIEFVINTTNHVYVVPLFFFSFEKYETFLSYAT